MRTTQTMYHRRPVYSLWFALLISGFGFLLLFSAPAGAGEVCDQPSAADADCVDSEFAATDVDEDAFDGDPLGLVAHADRYRDRTLGRQVWELWFCDLPLGDTTVRPEEVSRRLSREITPYFEWLSDGRYIPVFEVEGDVEAEDLDGCVSAARDRSPKALLAVVTDASDGQAFGGGRLMLLSADSVVQAPGRPKPRTSTIAHEIGHTLGWPHSYGGNTEYWPPTDSIWNPTDKWVGLVDEYDNPMDLMSGPNTSQANIATIAFNRYAAGWIHPEDVRIHQGGEATYHLSAPGVSGIQMLVLPAGRTGRFYTIGARVGLGHDIAVPRKGVEVYRVDQTTEESGIYAWGLATRIQPFPPEPHNASRTNLYMTDHVHQVGDSFKLGRYTVLVAEQTTGGFVVDVEGGTPPPDPEVSDPSPTDSGRQDDPGQAGSGRFSDDDENVHQASIEQIAGLGVTVGCNPPANDRYCPQQEVTRAQMMVFLVRALGGNPVSRAGPSRFSDVDESAWYRSSLEWLADRGVVTTYPDGTFRPDEPLTRLDMALFLVRAFEGIDPVTEPLGLFADVAADSEHAGAVEGLLAAGVTSGCSIDPFLYCPDQPVRRDQMASLLVRSLDAGRGDRREADN